MTRVGWCPGGRSVAEMLAAYPNPGVVRIFVQPGKPLPTWDGPVLGPIPPDVTVHLSFKTWDLPAVERWLMAMPERAPLILTYAHEPEQGTAAGDPTLAEFRTRWAELVAAMADHPRRDDVLLVPVYTRYWWQAHPGDVRWLLPPLGLAAYGWDVYNNGSSYRTPDDLLAIPRDIARRTGMPYLIPELGAIRLSSDRDGSGRQAWMRAMVAAATADGAWTVCWYHKDEWDLTGPGSVPEQQTWRELTQEASVDWHLAPALKALRDEINQRWPGRDKTSDGSIGDARHQVQGPKSDHNPNLRGSVNAIDVDKDGIDPYAVIAAFEKHPSAHYWIYQRQIADKDDGWRRRPYSGVNPHDHHVHFSIRQTRAAEDNTTPWGLSEDDDMPLSKDDIKNVAEAVLAANAGSSKNPVRWIDRTNEINANVAKLQATVTGLQAVIEQLAGVIKSGGGSVDTAGIIAGVEVVVRDAVADLGEGGAAQVRGTEKAS